MKPMSLNEQFDKISLLEPHLHSINLDYIREMGDCWTIKIFSQDRLHYLTFTSKTLNETIDKTIDHLQDRAERRK
jgi:hypothetical protein